MSRIARRVKQPGVYFVTSDTWERRQIFLKPEPAMIVLEQLLECGERGFYRLHAFVIMPENLHILITPGEGTSIEKAVMMIKGGSTFKIARELNYKFPIWFNGYHDRGIRDVREYRIRKQYSELNPARAKLVENSADYLAGLASGKYQMDRCAYDEGNFRG